jgi:hypothetical protein
MYQGEDGVNTNTNERTKQNTNGTLANYQRNAITIPRKV